jgi:hypothetical protein
MSTKDGTLGALPTRVAHAEWGVNRYFGFPVPDLLGDETLTGLVALAVGARRLPAAEREVLDDIAVAMTLADPRIWPLKMTRLVASYGGGLAGMAKKRRSVISPRAVRRGCSSPSARRHESRPLPRCSSPWAGA